jgi:hypothetical protein
MACRKRTRDQIQDDEAAACIAGPRAAAARAAVTVALAAMTGWAQSAAPAAIDVTAERLDDGIRIHAHALLRADVAGAWRVLTDYDRYAEFIPDLKVSRVVARNGATVTVEQSGDARVWLLRKRLDITYEITESPPDGIRSRAVAGSLRALRSRYVLTPASGGVELDYLGDVAPGFLLFGPIEQYAVERNIARQFQALADEIERRSPPPR